MFYRFFIHKTCMKCGVANDIGRTKKSVELFLSRIIDNRSYHDFFVITTFDNKSDKLKGFH